MSVVETVGRLPADRRARPFGRVQHVPGEVDRPHRPASEGQQHLLGGGAQEPYRENVYPPPPHPIALIN